MEDVTTHSNFHVPVLLDAIINFIDESRAQGSSPKQQARFFDATLGGGSYSKSFMNYGEVVACDLDPLAIENFRSNYNTTVLSTDSNRTNGTNDARTGLDPDTSLRLDQLTLIQGRFDEVLSSFPDQYFDYVIADLGYSSNQLESSQRGFSYLHPEEILDLRYDPNRDRSCWELLSCVQDVQKLRTVLYRYSGERFSGRIAEELYNLSRQKDGQPILVQEVVDRVKAALPEREKKHLNSTLSRVWQALRIWTNKEFEALERFLTLTTQKVVPGGYIMIVTFHSLEDKMVTKYMRDSARPFDLDDYGNKGQSFELITKKPITPSETEVANNVRSRSARLRILKRLI